MVPFNILILFVLSLTVARGSEEDEFGGDMITSMRQDEFADLSRDEEYEDLRAEMLAYHSALANLASSVTARRSLLTTPCWQMGGICIKQDLCYPFKYVSQAAGCRDRLRVCCFTWNKFKVKDMRDKGISNPAYPWTKVVNEYGQEMLSADHSTAQKNTSANISDADDEDQDDNIDRSGAIMLSKKKNINRSRTKLSSDNTKTESKNNDKSKKHRGRKGKRKNNEIFI